LVWLAARGATSVTLNAELPEASIAVLAKAGARPWIVWKPNVFM